MSDQPIPLYDGEPSGAKIIFEGADKAADTQTVRCKRSSLRRACQGVHVCFSVEIDIGRADHVECPVIDMSAKGLAIEYDAKLEIGVRGCVSYWSTSRRPVRVTGIVQRCEMLGRGRYALGLKLDSALDYDERRPAKKVPGRQVAMGLRPRKLREPMAHP